MFSWYLTTELSPKLLLYIFQGTAIKTCEARRSILEYCGLIFIYLSPFLLFPSFQNSLQSSVWLIICYSLCGKALLQESPVILNVWFYWHLSSHILSFLQYTWNFPSLTTWFFVSLNFQGPIYRLILISFLCPFPLNTLCFIL